MRIPLVYKITIALVLFGLIPASIVAWFAYDSNNDFRKIQATLVKQAAASISDRVGPLVFQDQQKEKEKEAAPTLTLSEPALNAIKREMRQIVEQFGIDDATVYIIVPDPKVGDRILVKRKPGGEFDQNPGLLTLSRRYAKYTEAGVLGPAVERSDPLSNDSEGTPELVGWAAMHLENSDRSANTKHSMTVVTLPFESAYATIYKNQKYTLFIMAAILVATVVLGIMLGNWFIRPLLEILDVSRQLHQGQLYYRTKVKRGDEVGDLASQINSVVDRFSEVISHIRNTTASLSNASSELKTSSGQLAKDRTSKPRPCKRLPAAFSRLIPRSVATPSTPRTRPAWPMKPAPRPRKGATRFARRSAPCARSPRRFSSSAISPIKPTCSL